MIEFNERFKDVTVGPELYREMFLVYKDHPPLVDAYEKLIASVSCVYLLLSIEQIKLFYMFIRLQRNFKICKPKLMNQNWKVLTEKLMKKLQVTNRHNLTKLYKNYIRFRLRKLPCRPFQT
jgi:hypothetical protein